MLRLWQDLAVCDAFPTISDCLIELEPMVRVFDEIEFLEAVLQIKKKKVSFYISSLCTCREICVALFFFLLKTTFDLFQN